jgi:hypothetical protein
MPNNPDHGPYLGLDSNTTSWTSIRRPAPKEIYAGGVYKVPLFEAKDDNGRILAHLQVELICRSLTPADLPLTEPFLKDGDWRGNAELKSAIDDRPIYARPPRQIASRPADYRDGRTSTSSPPRATSASATLESRIFTLRHKLGSEMADDLQQILLSRPGHKAEPTSDNLQLVVTAPPDVMKRVSTFINLQDWPMNAPRSPVLDTATRFFRSCTIEDEDIDRVSNLLSIYVLSQLKGKPLSELGFLEGNAPTPQVIKELRGNLPGKQEAIRKVMDAWNKYPLRQLREDPGIAMGFGLRYFCTLSFEGAPKDFIQVSLIHDGDRSSTAPLVIDSLPPWLETTKPEAESSTTTSVSTTLVHRS